MKTLISAALSGPELKKAKVKDPQLGKDHEFNIKSVTYRATLQLFEHSNFGGKSFEIGAGLCIIGDLKVHSFGDYISSIRWQSS